MFNVAMSNSSYQKVSNNTFFSYHRARTRPGTHKAPYLAGDEDLTPQRVKQSEPKTDYLVPCNYDIKNPWSYTSIPTHLFGMVSMREDNFTAAFIQRHISHRSNVSD